MADDSTKRHRLSPVTPFSSQEPSALFDEEEKRQIEEDFPRALAEFARWQTGRGPHP